MVDIEPRTFQTSCPVFEESVKTGVETLNMSGSSIERFRFTVDCCNIDLPSEYGSVCHLIDMNHDASYKSK